MKMEFHRNIPQSSKVIGVISTCVLLVLLFPWILVVLALSFLTGYFAILKFDSWIDRVSPLVVKYLGVHLLPQNNSTVVDSSSKTPYDDPLQQQLYLQEKKTSGGPSNSNSINCLVCSEPHCSRDDNLRHSSSLGSLPVPTSLSRSASASASSTPKFEPTPYQLPKVDDLKVDPRLDISISRFCSTVFDYYVGSYWAPYETRRQLKLAMKQFLYTLGDRINKKLITNPYQSPDQFCQAKVIPLVLHYFEKVNNHLGSSESIFPPEEQTKVRFKMRKLTRLVLEQSLSEDDLRCKLWMELCIAVLADGVLWNVMALGRDHLPELLEYYVNVAKIHFSPSVATLSVEASGDELQFHDATSYDETDASFGSSKKAFETSLDTKPVPFLLDNFLDRKDSLEQPDPIVSRWRPTLRDIIEETELLYPLIQYLKHVGGQKVLAYLQAVLDESPDAKEYCRRVLEVEYLPGFCRSHFFHESMGLSKVEQGMEVGADHQSPGSARRVKTHARSASYGSKSNPAISDFLKMDGGVVEGLPLHFDSDYGSLSANSSSSSAGSAYSSGGGASLPYSSTEPDAASVVSSASHSSSHSMFKRSKAPVEDAVTKFFNSTLSPGTGSGGHKKSSSVSATASSSSEFPLSSLSERPEVSAPRVGIHSKSYEDLNDPAVNSRVMVDPQKSDLLQKVTEFASSTITVNPWLGPVLSGWLDLLHPYLKPHFDSQVEESLKNFLSIDLCVTLVDLITDAFVNSGENLDDENIDDDDPKSEASDKSGSTSSKSLRHNSSPSPDIPEKNSIKRNHNQKSEGGKNASKNGGTEAIDSSLPESPSPDSSRNEKNTRDQKIDTFLQSFLKLFISRVISLDKFLSSFSTNRDYIFLFFVDILDLLVSELFADTSASKIFQQFQAARTQFAQAIAEMSGRPDCVEQLLQENVLQLLHGLLGDVSVTIQQNAATAVGKLASHSPSVAEMVVRADLLRKLIYSELERPNRYLKRAVLTALRSIVKQSPDLAKNVIEVGGLDFVVGAMEEFDAGVKEAAAFVLGGTAKHNLALATEVIGSGAVPLLVLSLQEPELTVRIVAANALSDISKHSPDTAQSAIDSGAVPHLVRATGNPDARLRRAALFSLASIAKHTLDMAEIIVEADVFPMVLEHAGHPDELVRKAATSLIKEVVKHSPDLAQLVVEGGGLGVLVNCVVRNKGENRIPAILALGFIAGHNPSLSFTTIYSKGIEALALAMDDEPESLVGASAAWSLGHIGRHSAEHAKHITSLGLLPKILQVYSTKGSSEEMKSKAKQALKMILLRTDDLESIEPLLTTAPPQIFKYVVAQYSKILPKDPAARKDFVTSGGLRKIQELLTPDSPEILREHIILINSCYPPEVVNYFSPDYPQTLLDSIESFKPTLNIDPSMWTEKLFSDTKIPSDVKDEILALQRTMHDNQAAQGRKASKETERKKSLRASGDAEGPAAGPGDALPGRVKSKKSLNPLAAAGATQDEPGKKLKKSIRPGGDAPVPLKA